MIKKENIFLKEWLRRPETAWFIINKEWKYWVEYIKKENWSEISLYFEYEKWLIYNHYEDWKKIAYNYFSKDFMERLMISAIWNNLLI